MRILMVCLGNICRSPLAEGILQHKANTAGLQWTVDSAGTSNYHIGEPPHKLSRKVALANNINISAHKGRQFTKADLDQFDKIYAMDSDNYNEIRRIAGNQWDASKVDLLLNALHPGQNRGVPDPWYGEEDGYHTVFDMISKACDHIIAESSSHVKA